MFDNNLSFKLCRELDDLFPGSMQVEQLGLGEAGDGLVWAAAEHGGFTIVTQDADFADLALHRGPPPRVIWLRCGNRPTTYIAALLRQRFEAIAGFDAHPDAVCLELR